MIPHISDQVCIAGLSAHGLMIVLYMWNLLFWCSFFDSGFEPLSLIFFLTVLSQVCSKIYETVHSSIIPKDSSLFIENPFLLIIMIQSIFSRKIWISYDFQATEQPDVYPEFSQWTHYGTNEPMESSLYVPLVTFCIIFKLVGGEFECSGWSSFHCKSNNYATKCLDLCSSLAYI